MKPAIVRPPAICFDLDGVLIDTMRLHAQAWQEALQPLGLRVARRAIYEWEGESGVVSARTLLSHSTQPSARAIRALLRDKERRFGRLARRVTVNPVLRSLLIRLKRRGVRLGLVTGTSRGEVRRALPRTVRGQFDVVVTGDRVRHGKPHPEPYLLACRRLKVLPRHVIVVENAPYGIQSARAAGAGLIVALTSSLPRRFLHEAHVIVGSVARLSAILDRLTLGSSI